MRTSKRLFLERLESRCLLVAGGCNPFNELDVNDDGQVAAQDALLIVNLLNEGPAAAAPVGEAESGYFYDVNGDTVASPIDALLVLNHLNNAGQTALPLVFSLSPADDPNGNAVVLKSAVTIQGQTSPGSRVRLRGGLDGETLATADASGRFQLPVALPTGKSTLQLDAVDGENRSKRLLGDVRVGDVVLDWNAALLNVVRDWTTFSNDPYPNRIVTSQPPMVARNLAMIHAAMFDASNAFTGEYEPYHVDLEAPAAGSQVAAVAAAAHRVASALYRDSDERAVFDATLAESLATVPEGTAVSLGVSFGQQVGDAILTWRAQDGATTPAKYEPGYSAGEWKRTYPDFYPPLLPQWPNVKPFAIGNASQFRPAPPPALGSTEYAAAVDEVMRLGGYGSTERSDDQTEIALFWADGGGTFTPPGHWNQIAADVSLAQGRSLSENAHLFAMLNVALADAGISAWDAKYAYGLWRPIDAIREAEQDGNGATHGDPAWLPLLRTPPFPTYTSGHSTFSGAAEVVLTRVFGGPISFWSRADGHAGFTQRPLDAKLVSTRTYKSFTQAAEEAGRSRVYGGIHFEFDNQAGLSAGRAIGAVIADNFFVRRH